MKRFQTSLLGDSDNILPKDEFQSVVPKSSVSSAKSSISSQKPTVYSTLPQSPLSNTPTPIYRHYRTIGEIQLYLEHFFIHLTTTEKIFCLLNPVSIVFNIVYIFYKFIKLNIEQSESNSNSSGSDSMVADAEMIACWVEFVGLLTLILLAGLFYKIDRLPSTLDCLRLSGEWSSFKLIYYLRPNAIVQLLSDSFTNDIFHFQKGQEENDADLTKNLRKILRDLGGSSNNDINNDNIDSEDEENNVINDSRVGNINNKNSEQKPDEYKNSNTNNDDDEYDYYDVSDDNDNNNNFKFYINKNENIYSHNTLENDKKIIRELIDKIEKTPRSRQTAIGDEWGYNPLRIIYAALKSVSGLFFIFGLFVGILAFIVTLTSFQFVSNKDSSNWTALEWFEIVGLINQFWSLMNIESRKLESVYQFLFIDCGSKQYNEPTVTRETQYKIMALDATIKDSLIRFHGFWGKLVALSNLTTLFLKIILKNPFEKPICVQIEEKYIDELAKHLKNNTNNENENKDSEDNDTHETKNGDEEDDNNHRSVSSETKGKQKKKKKKNKEIDWFKIKINKIAQRLQNTIENVPKTDYIARAQYVCTLRELIVYPKKIWLAAELMQNIFWRRLHSEVKTGGSGDKDLKIYNYEYGLAVSSSTIGTENSAKGEAIKIFSNFLNYPGVLIDYIHYHFWDTLFFTNTVVFTLCICVALWALIPAMNTSSSSSSNSSSNNKDNKSHIRDVADCESTYNYLLSYTAVFCFYCVVSVVGYLICYKFAKRDAKKFREETIKTMDYIKTEASQGRPRQDAGAHIELKENPIAAHNYNARTAQEDGIVYRDNYNYNGANGGSYDDNDNSDNDEYEDEMEALSSQPVALMRRQSSNDEASKKQQKRAYEIQRLNKKMLGTFISFIILFLIIAAFSIYPLALFWMSYDCRVGIIKDNYGMWIVAVGETTLNSLFFYFLLYAIARMFVRSIELTMLGVFMGIIDTVLFFYGFVFFKKSINNNLMNEYFDGGCKLFMILPSTILTVFTIKHIISIIACIIYFFQQKDTFLNVVVKHLNRCIFVLICIACFVMFVPCSGFFDDHEDYDYASDMMIVGIVWNGVFIAVMLSTFLIRFVVERLSDFSLITLKSMVIICGTQHIEVHGFWGLLFLITDRNRLYQINKTTNEQSNVYTVIEQM